MIRVLFFAGLREQLGCAEMEVAAAGASTLAELRESLSARGDRWRRALANPNIQMAVNRSVAAADCALASGDEVALFPPVTGG
ncbi:molybdopterin converting factor subunit 1 [Microbulbifer magnicolonia]|uniref:molybdopterin converting factor subunit 1 n=1 Tax=Microbulbifer magnicolonia TaxID=3109744 RepID=UPI002B40D3E9|nr:molybdopterin converting factor subunit 1 [Microbulbifer sp. GG15]